MADDALRACKEASASNKADLEGLVDVLLQVSVGDPLRHQLQKFREVDVATLVRVHRVSQVLERVFCLEDSN